LIPLAFSKLRTSLEGDIWRVVIEDNDCDLHVELSRRLDPPSDRSARCCDERRA
jgi:hypothetical protein